MKPIAEMSPVERREALRVARGLKPIAEMSPDERRELLKKAKIKQAQRQQGEQEGEERRGQIGENIVRGAGEILEDVPRAAIQAGTLGFYDELKGAVQAPFSDQSYEQIRDEERQAYRKAQDRSPITTLGAELLVPSPTKLVNVAGRAKKLLNAGEMATLATGLSEGETAGDVATEAGLMTAGGLLVGKALKEGGKALFSEPEIMRAKRLGVTTSDLPKETGTGTQVVEKLKETIGNLRNKNLFKYTDAVFDPKTNSFIRNPKAKKLDTIGTPSLSQIEARIDDALDKSSRYIEKKLGAKSKALKDSGQFFEGDYGINNRRKVKGASYTVDKLGTKEIPLDKTKRSSYTIKKTKPKQTGLDYITGNPIFEDVPAGKTTIAIRGDDTWPGKLAGVPRPNPKTEIVKVGKSTVRTGGGETWDGQLAGAQPLESARQFPARVDESGIYEKEFLKEYNDNELMGMINDDLIPSFGEEFEPQISKVFDESFVNLDVDGGGFNLADLQAEKQRLYNTSYDRETPDVVRATKRKLANLYKRMINDLSGDPKIAELNETMEQLFTVKDSLRKKIIGNAVDKEGLNVAPYGSLAYQASTAAEAAVDPSRFFRASVGEAADQFGEQFPNALDLIQQSGRRAIPVIKSRTGRSPQSIPEQLVRTPLPRDTAKLLEMKDFVLAKIAQMAPEMVDQIAEGMNNPATFQKILPLAVARFPNLFENDKYNRVDGKVLDPQSKQIASDDIMQDPNLSVYERAQLISKMNKTGYLEY